MKIRYDVFESRDGKAWIVWDRDTRSRANEDRFRLESDAQVVVDAMNASMNVAVTAPMPVAA